MFFWMFAVVGILLGAVIEWNKIDEKKQRARERQEQRANAERELAEMRRELAQLQTRQFVSALALEHSSQKLKLPPPMTRTILCPTTILTPPDTH